MASIISYIIILGIITFTSGKPALKEDTYLVKNEHELQKLLEALVNQGKYDIELSNHEDSSESYHDDKTRYTPHNEKPRKLYRSNKPSGRYSRGSVERLESDYGDQASLTNVQNYNIFDKKRASNNLQRISRNDNNILQKLIGLDGYNNNVGRGDEKNEYDNADEIVTFLDNLQKHLEDDADYDGSYNGKNRNARDDDDRGYRFDNRYDTSKQVKSLDDRDDRYDDRYDRNNRGRNLDDRDDKLDDKYDRGNRARNYEDRDYRFGDRNDRGNRARNVEDRDDRYDDDRDDRDALRNRNDLDRNNRDRETLRCRGNKCYKRSKYDYSDSELKLDSNNFIKKYKVSDDMDAVVLGLPDVDRLLTNLSPPKPQRSNKQRAEKLLENIDLENLLDRTGNDKKSNVEAVVFDLTQLENGDVLAKQIQRLLSKNDKASEAEYEDYGNFVEDNLKLGSFNLKKKAYKPRTDSKIVAHSEDNNNVYVPKWLLGEVLMKSKLRDASQVQLLKSVIPLTKQEKSRIMRVLDSKKVTSTLPPKKIFRRNFEQDVGVPFHLEVQGLGQVKP